MTSREAVDLVSLSIERLGTRQRHRRKIGHAGTLDPLASGVLLICIGSATRLIPFLHVHSKAYQAEFRFGERSNTDDLEGEITKCDGPLPQSTSEIEALLPEFTGRLLQRPPVYSAVKVSGRRAYQLAREDADVELIPRPVDIYRFALMAYTPPLARFEIECGSGTYIRSLARDLGERTGSGALMSALTRTSIGPFRIEDALEVADGVRLPLESIAEHLQPMSAGVSYLPTMLVSEGEAVLVRRGIRLPWTLVRPRPLLPPTTQVPASSDVVDLGGERIAIVQDGDDLVAIAEVLTDYVQPRTVFAV